MLDASREEEVRRAILDRDDRQLDLVEGSDWDGGDRRRAGPAAQLAAGQESCVCSAARHPAQPANRVLREIEYTREARVSERPGPQSRLRAVGLEHRPN